MSRISVLIVAAGKGERSGRAKPKQYEALQGKPMLARSAAAFGGLPIRVVIGPGQDDFYAAALPGGAAPITGGTRRQDSVRLGLEALSADAPDFVLIHDAARPLVSRRVIANVVAPGGVVTPMIEKLSPQAKEAILQTVPLRRFCEPEEVAKVVFFLAEEAPDYLNGSVVVLDGGAG